jgi:membrane-bound lytic murein transglycosylase A
MLILSSCASLTRTPRPPTPDVSTPTTTPIPSPTVVPPGRADAPACNCPEAPRPSTTAPQFQEVPWDALPGWGQDDLAPAFNAFLLGCRAARPQFAAVCSAATDIATDQESIREFFESRFVPQQVITADTKIDGLVTGYYEPLIRASRQRSAEYPVPVMGPPADLITVELADLYPELKGMRLRGRIEGKRLVPYYSRNEIEAGKGAAGKVLFWTNDAVEFFFVQVQGSARVRMDSGELIRINFADQNGHPYRSVGRALVERGELSLDKASMQGIKAWGKQNPDKLNAMLDTNPSFVFFRELPDSPSGPVGALGIPLTAGRSIAVDPRFIPLGAPVYLSTTLPGTPQPLNRLTFAQDTGGAIRGATRVDFYWGSGDEAGDLAGRMRQTGKLWLLAPRASR